MEIEPKDMDVRTLQTFINQNILMEGIEGCKIELEVRNDSFQKRRVLFLIPPKYEYYFYKKGVRKHKKKIIEVVEESILQYDRIIYPLDTNFNSIYYRVLVQPVLY